MTKNHDTDIDQLNAELEQALIDLQVARERERRAVADYQNLVRRQAEDRLRIAKMASADFVETILEPLTHLDFAAKQMGDQGLNMVVGQLWQKLNEVGLEEIDPSGKEFDVETMEAVPDPDRKVAQEDKAKGQGKKPTVSKVVSKGYKLNGEVVKHAKVIVSS